jgi:hypothetical protein
MNDASVQGPTVDDLMHWVKRSNSFEAENKRLRAALLDALEYARQTMPSNRYDAARLAAGSASSASASPDA